MSIFTVARFATRARPFPAKILDGLRSHLERVRALVAIARPGVADEFFPNIARSPTAVSRGDAPAARAAMHLPFAADDKTSFETFATERSSLFSRYPYPLGSEAMNSPRALRLQRPSTM